MMSFPRRPLLLAVASGLAAPLAAPRLARGATRVEIFSAAFPPMTVDDAAHPGFVNEVAREVLKLIGAEPHIVYMPWVDAQRRAQAEVGRLITPMGRTAAREALYTWLVKVFDTESAMAARGRSIDMATARTLPRIGVLRGSLHQAQLTGAGFTNLVEAPALVPLVTDLLDGKFDAVYGNTFDFPVIGARLGRAGELTVGPTLFTINQFIASGLNIGDLSPGDMEAAYAALEQDGTVARLHGQYFGTLARRA